MAYFSNGTEGLRFQERHCFNCVHNKENEEGFDECPIMDAHMFYQEEKQFQPMLNMLITEKLKCAMYHHNGELPKQKPVEDLPLFKE